MLRGTVLSPLGRPPPWLPPRGSFFVFVFVMLVGVCSPVTWRKRGFGVKEMLKYARFLQKTRGIVYLCTVSPSGGCGLKRNNFYYCRLRQCRSRRHPCGFCRGLFGLPAFLCLLLWPCNYCIAVLVDFYKIAVIVMAYTVNNMKVTFPSVLLNNLHDLCFPHLHAVDIVGQLL